ncbi:hypothetical protein E2C01_075513 [Portunus trituberculatus]|uniref:Secreted protein n=1 Tax=Portunus trituberculatus TaxID=210409 RepID=A0A5B7IG06_PORTR|nr:hypothetical protein [Portunus trituberculatus]
MTSASSAFLASYAFSLFSSTSAATFCSSSYISCSSISSSSSLLELTSRNGGKPLARLAGLVKKRPCDAVPRRIQE